MTGPWQTPHRSIARTGVMGLVVLSLLLVTLTWAWNGADADQGPTPASGHALGLGAWDAHLSTLPPQAGSAREHHVLSLWPPLRGARHSSSAHLALLPAPGLDAEHVRDPQQLAHRTAGSRSPPLI
ncbi:hypothetical protein FH608_022205 [Nonomuraea phyllanthi]|uniref:Uncharacterized protein n=1 Tax=Nonomuraea phyllanthi TaxID=2219224 RepID=A0A5C4WC16_9ACTN|nr:hypothetical protein [Nonomuraea phyllanthi]KAB8193049.1 hypothetical protein FH608_022205 [Nonomuraea phyllanthi]QFY11089.1 hypothetical protein GBF35_34855 [Nonomuraea phyllanthi]